MFYTISKICCLCLLTTVPEIVLHSMGEVEFFDRDHDRVPDRLLAAVRAPALGRGFVQDRTTITLTSIYTSVPLTTVGILLSLRGVNINIPDSRVLPVNPFLVMSTNKSVNDLPLIAVLEDET